MTQSGKETASHGPKTREGASARTMARILSAAMDIANQQGLTGLTIGALARSVGMSKSGVFARFNSKDNLQLAILELAAKDFSNQVVEPALRQQKGLARVEMLFESWVQYLNEDSQQGSLLLRVAREADTFSDEVQAFAQTTQRNLLASLERVLKGAKDMGDLAEECDVQLMARQWYWDMLGYFHFKFILNDEEAEPYLRKAFEQMIESLKGRRTRAS